MRPAILGRVLLVAAVAEVAAGVLPFAARPQEARACSLAPLSSAFDAVLAQTQIVAIGTWTDASEGSVTLHVAQALKGANAGDEIKVNNRQPGLSGSCETYYNSRLSGHRFKDGDQAVVLLEKQVDGLWRPSYFGMAVFAIPDGELEPLLMAGFPATYPAAPTLQDLERATGAKVSLPVQGFFPVHTVSTTPNAISGAPVTGGANTTASSRESRDWGYWVAGGGALLAIAFMVWVARQT